jgi:Predicted chitinase
MAKNTAQLRKEWHEFECNESSMVVVPFGPDKIRVAPPSAEAFAALGSVLAHHGYTIRTEDTDSYNCRPITKGSGKSLHSYGIALDVNWTTNPFLDHGTARLVRFSSQPTQDSRAQDVRLGLADTDMDPQMIDDVEKISTKAGIRVFEWGGRWKTRKDCMHFELDVSPDELAAGIDPDTVVGRDAPEIVAADLAMPLVAAATATPVSTMHLVIARDGLRLRAGPSTQFDVTRLVPHGTRVYVIGREAEWALVDLQGDGKADGFMSRAFLRAAEDLVGVAPAPSALPAAVPVPLMGGDITGLLGAELVAKMFPVTKFSSITSNLPFVLAGLRSRLLGDKPMVLMALATIRAETEGFVPIDEGASHFNTRAAPFDLYDAGTKIGFRLGNTQAGDGARFKGRGYVQLTGRSNYTRISKQIGVDLVANPPLANDPATAGAILAQFLKNAEGAVRSALANNDLVTARRLVNGGSHGLDRFRDAYERGQAALPA